MIDIISGLRGVKINGKHNKEFGIAMESASIGFPAKKKRNCSIYEWLLRFLYNWK